MASALSSLRSSWSVCSGCWARIPKREPRFTRSSSGQRAWAAGFSSCVIAEEPAQISKRFGFLRLQHRRCVKDLHAACGTGREVEAAAAGSRYHRPLVAAREGFVEALGHGAAGAILVEDLLGHRAPSSCRGWGSLPLPVGRKICSLRVFGNVCSVGVL